LASFAAGSTHNPAPLNFVECNSASEWEELAQPRRTYDVVIDALFGTGLIRPLTGTYVQVVQHLAVLRQAREQVEAKKPLILSLDVPSGLNADCAMPIGPAVEADLTVTFTAPKPANVLPPASYLGGKLVIASIGSPAVLIDSIKPDLFVAESSDARQWLKFTRYTTQSYKNTHGHSLIIAGSRDFSGAAALCGNAAMRSGAGLVTIATPISAQASVSSRAIPEVMTTALPETDRGAVSDEAVEHVKRLATKANALAIGPGLTAEDERTRNFVRRAVEKRTTPVVIDADGLNCLSPWPSDLKGTPESPLIITPHPGEMRRLLGTKDTEALADRVAVARDFARRHHVIVVLKGSQTLLAAPDGRVVVNPTGNPGLGTAGAGDTLTGVICGFLTQAYATLKGQADSFSATIAATYVSGLAGDIAARERGMRTMVASDICAHLSHAIMRLDRQGEIPLEFGVIN
jgi:NAD(P)H-hydrate epimerase